MKKMFFPLLALLFLGACETTMPVTGSLDDSYLMHVECNPGEATRKEVLLLLRRARAKDVKVDTMGANMSIEAAYYKTDNDIRVLEEIADDLRRVGTVVSVELRDNPRVVRENR
jgi:hypothetical protein